MTTPCSPPERGFTLVEMMIVVTLTAILTAVAMPSLRSFLARGQVSSAANELSATFQWARAQAVGRNRCVTVCRSADTANMLGTTPSTPSCALSGTQWHEGWLVFEDSTCGAGTQPADVAAVLRVHHNGTDGVTIQSQSIQRVIFDGKGMTGLATPQRFQIAPQEGSSNANARSLCLGRAGHVQIMTLTVNDCPVGS